MGVSDPIAHLALALAVLLVAARAAGEAAKRLGMPVVLGEITAGIALGAAPGTAFFHELAVDPSLDVLARLGAILLMFDAGLALAVRDVLRVGVAAARVAVLGTAASFALGFGVTSWVLPGSAIATRVFLSGALTATSVGVGARVLQDLGKSRTLEARTILGAAVIDDVLGLLILSAASAEARGGASGPGRRALLALGLKTTAFFAISLYGGPRVAPRLLALAARLTTRNALLITGLALCFAFAWAADAIGLAPIVGAFTAGLILEDAHARPFTSRGERGLEEVTEPLGAFLVPLFFVVLGLRTDLAALADRRAVALALGLTVAAVLGKLASGLGAPSGSNRLAVALGMLPRGEVTLVFASFAAIVDRQAHSALVVVVVATTLLAPVALKWSFARAGTKSQAGAAPSSTSRGRPPPSARS